MNAIFLADWCDVTFVHFRVSPQALQPLVPLPLDLLDGDAYVSLVAFTQKRLRPTVGGRIAAMLAAPLAQHEFLNVRTYVRHGDERGIYFMAEWIPNRLAELIGPRLYGLPYRLAKLEYEPDRQSVRCGRRELSLNVRSTRPIAPDETSNFLVERYTAYTSRRDIVRRFDIAHPAWTIEQAEVDMPRSDLLRPIAPFLVGAKPTSAHRSDGLRDVAISLPRVICQAARARRSRCQLLRTGSADCP